MKHFVICIMTSIPFYISGCGKEQVDGQKAGIEFCNCLKLNNSLRNESAIKLCNEVISEKYPLFNRYIHSRDSSSNLILDKSQEDRMFVFIRNFTNAVDSCNPPNWFKTD